MKLSKPLLTALGVSAVVLAGSGITIAQMNTQNEPEPVDVVAEVIPTPVEKIVDKPIPTSTPTAKPTKAPVVLPVPKPTPTPTPTPEPSGEPTPAPTKTPFPVATPAPLTVDYSDFMRPGWIVDELNRQIAEGMTELELEGMNFNMFERQLQHAARGQGSTYFDDFPDHYYYHTGNLRYKGLLVYRTIRLVKDPMNAL